MDDAGRLLDFLVMDLPASNDQYATKDYWNKRYVNEVDYDWFARYDSFAHHMARTVNKSDRILQLGICYLFIFSRHLEHGVFYRLFKAVGVV